MTVPAEICRAFRRAGRQLLLLGMNSSHSGNMSVRAGERLFIKRTGAMTGDLRPGDLVEAHLSDAAPPGASMEYPVHRAVYLSSQAGAVIHCHPPHAVALAFGREAVVPIDLEGVRLLGEVPVIASGEPEAVAARIGEGCPVVLVRGHGAFAAGRNLEEVLHRLSSLEMASKILILSGRG